MVYRLLETRKYDVWISNSRESLQTKEHEKYTINDSEFWDFSFYDMAKHDIPAFVDYVLNKTGKS